MMNTKQTFIKHIYLFKINKLQYQHYRCEDNHINLARSLNKLLHIALIGMQFDEANRRFFSNWLYLNSKSIKDDIESLIEYCKESCSHDVIALKKQLEFLTGAIIRQINPPNNALIHDNDYIEEPIVNINQTSCVQQNEQQKEKIFACLAQLMSKTYEKINDEFY